eukprot:540869_1
MTDFTVTSHSNLLEINNTELIINGYIRLTITPLLSPNTIIPQSIVNICYIYFTNPNTLILSLEFKGNFTQIAGNHNYDWQVGRIFTPFNITFNNKTIYCNTKNMYQCYYSAWKTDQRKERTHLLNRPQASTCFSSNLFSIFHIGGHRDDFCGIRYTPPIQYNHVTMIKFHKKQLLYDIINLPELPIGGPTTCVYSNRNGLIVGVSQRDFVMHGFYDDYKRLRRIKPVDEYKVNEIYCEKRLFLQMKFDNKYDFKELEWIELMDNNDNMVSNEAEICNLENENKLLSLCRNGVKMYEFEECKWNDLMNAEKMKEFNMFDDIVIRDSNYGLRSGWVRKCVMEFNEMNKNVYIGFKIENRCFTDRIFGNNIYKNIGIMEQNLYEYNLNKNEICVLACLKSGKNIVKIWNDERNENIIYICSQMNSGDLCFDYCDVRIKKCFQIDMNIQMDCMKEYSTWADKQQLKGYRLNKVSGVSRLDLV